MDLEKYTQPFLLFSLVAFIFSLFFFKVPAENNELIKMGLTSLISFISGTSLAFAMIKASKDNDKRR